MTRHQTPGTITLVGTPAEEAGGGKDVLIKKGAFDEFDACLMIHPTPGITEGQNGLGAIQGTLAVQQFGVEFFGHTAHAVRIWSFWGYCQHELIGFPFLMMSC